MRPRSCGSEARVDPANAPKTKTDTKYNLILSALELFAENGVDAVSMRTINNAAGTKNASAVHYHFGSKVGIIEAIIAFIREELDTSRLDALTALEERVRNGERPGCREIMWAAFASVLPALQHARLRHPRVAVSRAPADRHEPRNPGHPESRHAPDRAPVRRAARARIARAARPDPAHALLYFWTLTVQMFAGSGNLDIDRVRRSANLRRRRAAAALLRLSRRRHGRPVSRDLPERELQRVCGTSFERGMAVRVGHAQAIHGRSPAPSMARRVRRNEHASPLCRVSIDTDLGGVNARFARVHPSTSQKPVPGTASHPDKSLPVLAPAVTYSSRTKARLPSVEGATGDRCGGASPFAGPEHRSPVALPDRYSARPGSPITRRPTPSIPPRFYNELTV